ncbi:hypothetical protein GF391_01215 [Candidatus Uhrbacteria bacterium]|nr:hypothetical protein [Candidatus Uhrbacteria bacterium]
MFISVIPAVKMPYGHCFFDYELDEGTAHVGDVILVPFRKRKIAALVAKKSPLSDWAEKAIKISEPQKIAKLPEAMAEMCIQAAAESFVSPPTMLNAWFRTVPKRHPDPSEIHTPPRNTHMPADADLLERRYLVNRYKGPDGIIETVRQNQANGRILLLTPWQRRADIIAKKLGCPVLHAETAYGAAWKSWTDFLSRANALLVTTRLGAWLAGAVDIVVVDEPENDDFKQDELTPRYDARRLIELARRANPALRIIKIGTTPNLAEYADFPESEAALIEPDITFSRFDPNNRSGIEMVTGTVFEAISEAASHGKPVRILHTVYGTRGKIRCADCDWTMWCEDCDMGMHNMQTHALCRRCGKKQDMPPACPMCGSVNLAKAVIGSDGLLRACRQHFARADIKVLDTHEWLRQILQPDSLLIATNINYIGGYVEDIRRMERLVISFRRLAAQSCVAKCKLIVQGASPLIDTCPSWLTGQGVRKTYDLELQDRQAFGYPPAQTMAKLIAPGKIEDSLVIQSKLQTICDNKQGWRFRGPFTVEYWSKNREPRCVFHILPPYGVDRAQLVDELAVLTAFGIIDLDPVAFFC